MSAFGKDIFREIKNTLGRFVSLIVITMLGASSVVGIQATSIDMRAVADKMYKEHNLYDIQLKSTTGFDEDDIAALNDTAGVSKVMPTNIYDAFVSVENENRSVRTYALPDRINTIDVLEGRLPANANECAVEQKMLNDGELKIGDSIHLSLDNMSDYNNTFASDTFTVVGTVSSPLYISMQRGNTALGNGSLRYYMYLHSDAYVLDIYTDVYLTMDGSRDTDNLTDEYYDTADKWKTRIEQTGTERVQAKADKLAGMGMSGIVPAPEWFYFTRKDGLAFDSYYQDTLRLEKIGYVFPLVFFLVAIMVSLTSLSRMVEGHRTQIGIYKALGYRPSAIMMKYLIYAFAAGLIGSFAGVVLGSRLFPFVIADAYGHLYDMPPVKMPVPAFIAMLAVAAAVLSVVSVTLLTCIGSMTGTPSVLMRPKPPRSGKRVWLERIPFIWNKFGFFSKVTSRNILRYKRRFVMTLFGVAGCSALLLTAFGLRDSIGGVAVLQYEDIVKYDSRAYLRDITAPEQRAELDDVLPDKHLYIREEAVTANGASGGLPASLIVPEDCETLNGYINFYSPEAKETIRTDSQSVFITEKLSRVMGAGTGESFTMTYSDGSTFTAEVTGVVDNYVQHYIYMSPDVYTETFGKEPHPNSVLMFGLKKEHHELSAPLLENGDVRAVVYNSELLSQISDSTDAMGIVTIVLIVLACALALVVLFNLTNINISERVRELATIKVLGFSDVELAMYIYRENAVVTLIGVLLGLIGGVFLHGFVITTIEIDVLKFPKLIYPISYVLAVVLSVVFAVFVNFVMNYRLAKIDMVESLKNVE